MKITLCLFVFLNVVYSFTSQSSFRKLPDRSTTQTILTETLTLQNSLPISNINSSPLLESSLGLVATSLVVNAGFSGNIFCYGGRSNLNPTPLDPISVNNNGFQLPFQSQTVSTANSSDGYIACYFLPNSGTIEIEYESFLGGSNDDTIEDLIFINGDANGGNSFLIVGGTTTSDDLPNIRNLTDFTTGFVPNLMGQRSAFVSIISPSNILSFYLGTIYSLAPSSDPVVSLAISPDQILTISVNYFDNFLVTPPGFPCVGCTFNTNDTFIFSVRLNLGGIPETLSATQLNSVFGSYLTVSNLNQIGLVSRVPGSETINTIPSEATPLSNFENTFPNQNQVSILDQTTAELNFNSELQTNLGLLGVGNSVFSQNNFYVTGTVLDASPFSNVDVSPSAPFLIGINPLSLTPLIDFEPLVRAGTSVNWHPSETQAITSIPNFIFTTPSISPNSAIDYIFDSLNPLDIDITTISNSPTLNPNSTYAVLNIIAINFAEIPIEFIISSPIMENALIHRITVTGTPSATITLNMVGIRESSNSSDLELFVVTSEIVGLSSLISTSSTTTNDTSNSSSDQTGLIVGLVIGITCCCFIGIVILIIGALFTLSKTENPFFRSELDEIYSNDKKDRIESDNNPTNGLDNIEIESQIGVGNFGQVFKGLWNNSTPVALKTLKQNDIGLSDFEKEALALMQISHHVNIVRFLGFYIGQNAQLYMVTEFLPDGSLDRILEAKIVSIFHKVYVINGIISGMRFLYELNFIHRDLGIRNILIKIENDRYVPKISDFGLSRFLERNDYYKSDSATIPIRWTAPEALSRGKWGFPSDVFSFGVCCWEIFENAKRPWGEAISNKEVYKKVTTGENLGKAREMPEKVWQILKDCFAFLPKERPTFEELSKYFPPLLELFEPTEL